MSRVSFIFFSILLLVAIYGQLYVEGARLPVVTYILTVFSISYCALAMVLALMHLLRWFLNDDGDIIRTCLTFVYGACWIGLLSYGLTKLANGELHLGNFGHFGV